MIEHRIKEETLTVINEIEGNPQATQRVLAAKLGFSLGKTNHLIKELLKKGIIKVIDFSHNSGKFEKIRYILTHKGIDEKMLLISHFLKIKEMEYNKLKNDWLKLAKAGTSQRLMEEKIQ